MPVYVDAGLGRRVHDEGFHGIRNRSELLARCETPEEAVTCVVTVLPEGLGPAR
ncbi:hypothetical protein [Kitasatospora paranensis]|uniref:Uncharacterized protein n=1 Tax=Kitasatospora paranensis TaxID=258053 RepID=A0ABW2FTD9_9ACTN